MKTRLTIILAIFAVAIASAQTTADSLNYAIGMAQGSRFANSYSAEKSGDRKALVNFTKGFTKTFYATIGSSDEIFMRGYLTGGTLAKEFFHGFLFEDSTLKSDRALLVDGFKVGVTDAYFPMTKEQCYAVIQGVVTSGMQDSTKRVPSVSLLDSLNLCLGYVAGCQTRMTLIGSDTTCDAMRIFLKGFDKGVKINKSAYPEIEGVNVAMSLSHQLNDMKCFMNDESYPVSRELISRGFVDALDYDPAKKRAKVMMDPAAAESFINSVVEVVTSKQIAILKTKADSFLVENAKRPGVIVTASGLQYEVIAEGEGPKPAATDTVTAHYVGTFVDGSLFDSSVDRGEPIVFLPGNVIPGWAEGIQLMSKGAKYRFYIPYDLAYGPEGAGEDIPPYAVLIFEIELLDFHSTNP